MSQQLLNIIRPKIAAAIDHEKRTGTAAQMMRQLALNSGLQPGPADIEGAVSFLREYVEQVPTHIASGFAASGKVGLEAEMTRLMTAAVQYWREPNDAIPDHLGLVGVVDDAYVTMSLLQHASANFAQRTGRMLLANDFSSANAAVRVIIGEPAASILDGIVQQSLGAPSFEQMLGHFVQMAGARGFPSPMINPPDPIWGRATVDEIVNVRLGAMGVV